MRAIVRALVVVATASLMAGSSATVRAGTSPSLGDTSVLSNPVFLNSRGQKIAFIHPKGAHGVLIELYQYVQTDGS